MGIVLSLEQNKVDIPTIRAVRVAAMGPLGGIGDALFWFTLVPITAGITSNMATEVPALANGIERSCGSIVPGRDADVVILNADLTLDATYVGGSLVR